MKAKHLKTLSDVFQSPTRPNIAFSDIEALVRALGGTVSEGAGSRVKMSVKGFVFRAHRPHPAKEAKRYQVEELRELLEGAGITPSNVEE
jgi:hypothetical protein